VAKSKTIFVCQECGGEYPRWQGKCDACGKWNTLVEEKAEPEGTGQASRRLDTAGGKPTPISQVARIDDPRILTGMDEFDRILGGGVVVGSAVLVGGAPGIGKSTLLLQVAHNVAGGGGRVLYVTSEESTLQMRLRAERLNVLSDNLLVLAETDVGLVLKHLADVKPDMAIVDSVQMIYSQELASAPGSVGQLRECAARLVYHAKRSGSPVFLVGHVTKGGIIAGPRALEHMVDTVLYFEGDRYRSFRVIRSVKNRFGSTDEIAVMEMQRDGLKEVANPSSMFLAERNRPRSGSVVVPCMQGSRALLVEVQALISHAGYGTAERKVTGADYNRVCMLMAVLERRVGLKLEGQDIFVNVVGGVRIDEPAADLAIASAMASSVENFPIQTDVVLMGEVGLGGELRGVAYAESRLKEAAKLGFKLAIIPAANATEHIVANSLQIIPLHTLSEVLDRLR
jgi:DNA repair protein RadA/Sms